MKHYIEEAASHVHLEEGTRIIEQLLIECYMYPGISTKTLARKTLLPVPVAAAVKKELINAGALRQERGVTCTEEGKSFVEKRLGFKGLQKALYQKLLGKEKKWQTELSEVLKKLHTLFQTRPQVNVQIDQSKCTPETSLNRAVLCLQHHALIGKKILCVGDDDLVSISLGLLLRQLFPHGNLGQTEIHVTDIDNRFLDYIRLLADQEGLPIRCHFHDLREPFSSEKLNGFDCFFTDPPYTMEGMSLFVSRGISALKREKGLPVFLSYAHKSPAFMLAMQREFVQMGLMTKEVIPYFNKYEGAEMIANQGQMIILNTTDLTKPTIEGSYKQAIYTGEIKQTLRIYECKSCGHQVPVGATGKVATIEVLKHQGCPECKSTIFQLTVRKSG